LLADIQAKLASPSQRLTLLDQLDGCLTEIERQIAEWDRFFAERGIVPIEVEYEDLVADSAAVTDRILGFLGLDVPEKVDFSRSWLRPMSDERNETLVAAYAGSRAGR
jgi:LPS sulfotransferase NodH